MDRPSICVVTAEGASARAAANGELAQWFLREAREARRAGLEFQRRVSLRLALNFRARRKRFSERKESKS